MMLTNSTPSKAASCQTLFTLKIKEVKIKEYTVLIYE